MKIHKGILVDTFWFRFSFVNFVSFVVLDFVFLSLH
jgi:hypothetical protein